MLLTLAADCGRGTGKLEVDVRGHLTRAASSDITTEKTCGNLSTLVEPRIGTGTQRFRFVFQTVECPPRRLP